ncbi:MAG TPA: Ig-like domain-containing protein [Gemmatimonadales bacterium]|nr:Ig-like domain-containing protein [Gemmatimonadales bacterium]
MDQIGPSRLVSGVLTSWKDTTLAPSTKVDARAARFAGGANIPVKIGGDSGICFSGGVIIGALPPSTTWSRMHNTWALVVMAARSVTLENVRIFDYGDGPSFDAQGDVAWSIRGMYLKYMRDDCIENDFLNSGTIDDSFLDGCYDGISSRAYSGVQDGSNNVVVVRNSLIRLQAMDQAYGGAVPNHNAFWKWSPSIGPKVALYNTIFRADARSREGNGAGMYMAPPPGKLTDCENNVMVWLGSGSFPEPLPTTFNGKPCFRLLTGAEGLQYWNDAAAQWKANHAWVLEDVSAPIVSLFSPGIVGSTTLTGTVKLAATAVDDQNVAGVQFQLNGQNLGWEVKVGSLLTNFSKWWDSRSVVNGTYTLTATARDTAGRLTTSAGVTVTISN